MDDARTQLVASRALAERTVAIEAAYTLSRLQVLERLPGNPVGVEYRRLGGGGVALTARHLPVPSFNSIVGLRAGDEKELEPLLAWYRANEVEPRIELVPALADASLARELARLGFFQSGFHTSLVCEPDLELARDAPVPIEVVRADTLDPFLDTHAAGWGIPDPAGFRANVSGWLGLPGWTLYLALRDGKPAATAILYVADRVGYCADAATRPELRGRGLQTALLRRRIADARAAGVDFVCSGADYASTSHRNMERVGMRVQFVRALWTRI